MRVFPIGFWVWTLKTSQLDALRLIHKYPKTVQTRLSDCGPKWRSAGSGYVAKMKTVDTPAECQRLSHASWLRGKEWRQEWKNERKRHDANDQPWDTGPASEWGPDPAPGMPCNSSHIRCQPGKLTQLFTQLPLTLSPSLALLSQSSRRELCGLEQMLVENWVWCGSLWATPRGRSLQKAKLCLADLDFKSLWYRIREITPAGAT